MRNILLSLTTMTLMLAGAPAAAQQAPQSGAKAQVTASARIISGESIRFGASTQRVAAKQRLNGKGGHVFSLARTRGEVALDGQSHVSVTEFH